MRWYLACFFFLAVSGCAPLQIYYRAGVDIQKLEADQLQCEVQALKDAPVAPQTRLTPPRYIPPRTHCDTQGNCVTKGGFFLPGEIYTVDANADLRVRVERQCMAQRGYQPTSIPLCPPDVAQRVPPGKTRILPALSDQSCAIRNQDGSFQIVTHG